MDANIPVNTTYPRSPKDFIDPEQSRSHNPQGQADVPQYRLSIVVRVFKRQYSLYKTTFRDGQDTAKRDFDLSKSMIFTLPSKGATKRSITVEFFLPSAGESYFKVNLTKLTSGDKKEFEEGIRQRIEPLLYGSDLQIISTAEAS